MIEDKTHKVKVWDHNDAVIYVTDTFYIQRKDPNNPDKFISKEQKGVLAVVPVNSSEGITETFLENVQKAADALANLYSNEPDSEVKVTYSINAYPAVNL